MKTKKKYSLSAKEGYYHSTFDMSSLGYRQSNQFKYKKSEAYLSNMFFYELTCLGIEIVPEFSDGKNRYDYIILRDGDPVCIVEIKGSRRAVDMAQIARYEKNSFGVPVYVMAGHEMFTITLGDVLKLFK